MNEIIFKSMALLIEIVKDNSSCTTMCKQDECICSELKKKASETLMSLFPLIEKEKEMAMTLMQEFSARQAGIIKP